MTAKDFYNKRAFKHQLKRAIKYDKQYFEDCIIELMEQYAQEQVKNLTIPVVSQQRELLIGYAKMIMKVEYEHTQQLIEDDIDEYLANL